MADPAFEYVTDARGRRTRVILPVRHYEKLLEDLHDLAVVAERRDERTIGLDDLMQRLQEPARP
jgi:hypothetical protein